MPGNKAAVTAARAKAQRMRAQKVGGKVPPFPAWIDRVGVDFLVTKLNVSKWTVYSWRRKAMGFTGGAYPKREMLPEIIRLAKGDVSAVDIYASPPSKP